MENLAFADAGPVTLEERNGGIFNGKANFKRVTLSPTNSSPGVWRSKILPRSDVEFVNM